jgi:hypothetical protein
MLNLIADLQEAMALLPYRLSVIMNNPKHGCSVCCRSFIGVYLYQEDWTKAAEAAPVINSGEFSLFTPEDYHMGSRWILGQ